MNGEWIFLEIARWIAPLVLAYIAYRLGLRSQRIQALREYITEVAGDEYPALFSEIKRNLELLNNYLEKPNINFDFPELGQIYNSGYDRFMERHHKDLFLMIDSFQKKNVPKFHELTKLFWDLREKMCDAWLSHLGKSLPKEVVSTNQNIVHDLLRTINQYYVLPDFLNERYEVIRNKIEACILDKTSHIYREKAKKPYVIREQQRAIGFDEISQSLIEKGKPEVAKFLEIYKELKKQCDKEVKERILPLLQEYISNPIQG